MRTLENASNPLKTKTERNAEQAAKNIGDVVCIGMANPQVLILELADNLAKNGYQDIAKHLRKDWQ